MFIAHIDAIRYYSICLSISTRFETFVTTLEKLTVPTVSLYCTSTCTSERGMPIFNSGGASTKKTFFWDCEQHVLPGKKAFFYFRKRRKVTPTKMKGRILPKREREREPAVHAF